MFDLNKAIEDAKKGVETAKKGVETTKRAVAAAKDAFEKAEDEADEQQKAPKVEAKADSKTEKASKTPRHSKEAKTSKGAEKSEQEAEQTLIPEIKVPERNYRVAAILAALLGFIGAHCIYLNRKLELIGHIVALFIAGWLANVMNSNMPIMLVCLVSIIEAIVFILTKSTDSLFTTNSKDIGRKIKEQLKKDESQSANGKGSLTDIAMLFGALVMAWAVLSAGISPSNAATQKVEPETKSAATTKAASTVAASTAAAVVPATTEPVALEDMEVTFIDVGQGDATLVKLPDGKVLLVDGGPDIEAKQIKTLLDVQGIKTIDYAVITHGDIDHITGMSEILDNYDVSEFYAPKVTQSTDSYLNLLEKVQEKSIDAHAAWAGDVIDEGDGFSVKVLSPEDGQTYNESNDWSAVLLLTYKDTKILLTGDAPKEVLKNLNIGEIDLLKVAHHGSDTGTDTELVNNLKPTDAVISYALANEYGHPVQSVINALIGVKLYGTAVNGNITAVSNGLSVEVKTEKEGTVTAPVTETEEQAQAEAEAEAAAAEAAAAEATAAAEAQAQQQAAPVQTEKTVVITPTGAKYHNRGCRTLSRSKTLTELTVSEAQARGYEACGVCNP